MMRVLTQNSTSQTAAPVRKPRSLQAHARLASSIARNQDDLEAGGSSERWKDLENEVDELLEKVRYLGRSTCT